MVVKRKIIHAAKYGFLILLVSTLCVFVSFLHSSQQGPAPFDKFGDDFLYFPDIVLQFSQDMLDKNFDICFFHPFVFNDDGQMNSSLKELFPSFSKYKDIQEYASNETVRTYPLFKVVTEFADLMSVLNIEAVLIEPALLFCMLSPLHKSRLLRRDFNPKKYLNSTRVVTFGIQETYIPILEKAEIQAQLMKYDFSIEFIMEPLAEWMKISKANSSQTHFTSHMFFKQNNFTVHLVVFYGRGVYLWHAAMKSLSYENLPPIEELHFAEVDSAYDGLTAVSPGFTEKALANISIPSNPQYFLFEMMSSKFLECNSSVVERFSHIRPASHKRYRSPRKQRRFENRVIVALRELKVKLNPSLIRFWIWSGTLLGWYRQCGVIPYTNDADFGAWSTDLDGLDQLTRLFHKDENLKLRERMGLIQQGLELNLNCHKVRVDLFFVYEESNGTWYAGHRPGKGYYFKYHHPNFSLCSAELLEHKVLVPCEAEDVIAMEYGPNWMTPVTKWNYEKSIKNRGPNIYWNKTMRKKAYA